MSGPEARLIKAHLKTCTECKALLDEELAFDARLAAVPVVEPVNDVWVLVRARTKPRKFSPFVWLARIRSAGATAKRAAAAAAVIGVAAVTLYSFTLNRSDLAPSYISKGAENVITVKWSDDPLGGHREALVECIGKM